MQLLHILKIFGSNAYIISIILLFRNHLFLAIGAICAELLPHLGCLNAAIILHSILLKGVMGAPLALFDVTPTGRILARFSKDTDVVDNTIPQCLIDTLYCIMEVNEGSRKIEKREPFSSDCNS